MSTPTPSRANVEFYQKLEKIRRLSGTNLCLGEEPNCLGEGCGSFSLSEKPLHVGEVLRPTRRRQ